MLVYKVSPSLLHQFHLYIPSFETHLFGPKNTAQIKEGLDELSELDGIPSPFIDKDKLIIKAGDLLRVVHAFLDKEIEHRKRLTKCLRLIKERVKLKKWKEKKANELEHIKRKLKNNATNMSNMIEFE